MPTRLWFANVEQDKKNEDEDLLLNKKQGDLSIWALFEALVFEAKVSQMEFPDSNVTQVTRQ